MTYAIGIDLGTTHTALAYVDLDLVDGEDAPPSVLAIPQLVSAGALEARSLLPSFLYLPHSGESHPLPWDAATPEGRGFVVGELARARAAELPARVVASSKSWLCHAGVDRRAAILPQLPAGAVTDPDLPRLSPVVAAQRFLEHLREVWDQKQEPLAEQEVVLTVPASFDAAARELTAEAARAAGIAHLTLLEEPQAALYAWIEQSRGAWRKEVKVGDVILVVDVGGGTTDFSAIAVTESEGGLDLRRVAVGEHILLGGDNMDLALAHAVRADLEAQGKYLDPLQAQALVHACRAGKEQLLSDPSLAAVPIALAGRGSKLVGSVIRAELSRVRLESLLVEGFFPVVEGSARPVTRARVGLTQLGLPYAQDPAVTRHLAAFLGRQVAAAGNAEGRTLLHPTAILFNGGVMKADPLRTRLVDTLNAWLVADGGAPARVLAGEDLDLSVARGAAYYATTRRGRGVRIRGGTARSYYVGIEGAAPAVPGIEPPLVALCVAPFGVEEGSPPARAPQELGLVVGEPVRFRFFGSTVRRDDRVGHALERWKPGDELDELPAIEATVPSEGRRVGDVVPVQIESTVTEIGTLRLEAISADGARFALELNVREP